MCYLYQSMNTRFFFLTSIDARCHRASLVGSIFIYSSLNQDTLINTNMWEYIDTKIEEFYDKLQNVIDRTFLLCKETGMQKWARMHMKTGKPFLDSSAMTTQMREDSDFLSLPPLTIFCWRPHLVISKHQEDKPGIAQMDKTTIRSITF